MHIKLFRITLIWVAITFMTGCEQAVEHFILTTLEARKNTSDELFRKDQITIVTCGTGSPLPIGTAVQSCTAVFVNGQFLLFDAGDGAIRSMEDSMLPLEDISAMFLTHFHADHWADMAEVIDRSWLLGRRHVFPIYGGQGIEQIVNDTTSAYSLEYSYRTAHHGEQVMPPESVEVIPTTINVSGTDTVIVYEKDGVVVTAFNVKHSPIEPALGFKISFAGKEIVISGDTIETETLAAQSQSVDVLVSEVMNMEFIALAEKVFSENGYEDNAIIFHDIQDYHISTTQLATLAEAAEVKHLILTHLAPNIDNAKIMDTLFRKPMERIFTGELSIAKDGNHYVIPL